jgi:hypothetical protein
MSETPTKPVQVLMPAALLPRLAEPLATIGMRLYDLPTQDGSTLMIAADLSEVRDQSASFTTEDVLEAWLLAVEMLAETAQKAGRRPRTRKRKAARDAPELPARTPGDAEEATDER